MRTFNLFCLPIFLLFMSATPAFSAEDADALAEQAERDFLADNCTQAIAGWAQAAKLFAESGDVQKQADCLAGIGGANLKLGNLDKAEESLGKAQKLYAGLQATLGQAQCLTNLAQVAFLRGDLESSLKLRQQALTLREKIDDSTGRGIDLIGIAQVYSKKGERRKAVDTYTEALNIFAVEDNSRGLAAAVSGIGIEYGKLGAHDMALVCHEESLSRHQILEDEFQQARDLTNIGNIYSAIADYQTAQQKYQAALEIQKKLEDRQGMAKSLVNLGVCAKNFGQYAPALKHLNQARRIFEETGSKSGLADCYSNLGILFKVLGHLNKAENYHRQAMRLHLAVGDEPNRAADLANLGVVRALQEQNEQALKLFEQACDLYTKTGDKKQAAVAAANAALVLLKQGKLQEFQKNIKGAAADFETLHYTPGVVRCLLASAKVMQENGKIDEADSLCTQAMSTCDNSCEPELHGLCMSRSADVQLARGNTDEAITLYRQAAAEIERLRRNVGSFQLASAFLSDRGEVYAKLVALLAAQGDAAGAFEALERGRARGFADMLVEAGADIRKGADEQLVLQEKFLLARMAAINATIASERAEGAEEERVQALEMKLQNTIAEYQQLQVDLRQNSPKYARLYYPEPLKLADLQKSLPADTVMLEYSLGEEKSWLFAVTADTIKLYPLPSLDRIRENAKALRLLILDRRGRPYVEKARNLYQQLIAPAEGPLANCDQIIVVPDDVLHFVPFECLLTEDVQRIDYAELPYLLRKAAIVYAPSSAAYVQLAKQPGVKQYDKEILICADPDFGSQENEVRIAMRDSLNVKSAMLRLPYSALEAKNISSVFPPEGVTLLERQDASEKRLKAMDLSVYRYVNFATHALYDAERPEFSSIVLAQNADDEDGFLQMQEIFNLDLNAELVTLSACSTGRGKLLDGEGLVGLTRAFFYAGTSSVVASQWSVSDASTSKLMTNFYRNLKDGGMSRAEALRRAKLSLIEKTDTRPFAVVSDSPADIADGSYSHPFYWAAFTLHGE